MKVILDDFINKELIDYLKTQEGINEVNINEKDVYIEVEIKHNDKITSNIIMKHIDLFLENNFSSIMAFDKEININKKKLKYNAGDLCCEYCYKGFVREVFEDKRIISLKSNYDLYKPAIDIKLEIEYDDNYREEEIIKFIKDNI